MEHLGFGLGACPFFLHAKRRCDSIWIVHSSVQRTSWNVSFKWSRANCRRLALFASLISWQYALPRNVHPRDSLHRKMVLRLMLYPALTSSSCSWYAVVSSSSSICRSTNSFTSLVIFDGRPEPGTREIDPVSSNVRRKPWIPRRLHLIPSRARSLWMVGALRPFK